jgi:RNA-binding protein MEX3
MMLQDQENLQLVLDSLSYMQRHGNVCNVLGTRQPKAMSTQPYNGMVYTITEKSLFRDINGFDMKRAASIASNAANLSNITEHVYVPTSEHVAEIVGRQGCKIKALRNKTNTYIKTPGRGEEPLFIITGQKEDVELAKSEIVQASEHFTNIRAQRKSGLAPPTNIPGQITIKVKVPYRVVGLVVGPKGATIKQIQTKTSTYIVTPSREREPVFEITGLPKNVEHAKNEITNYIAIRTGVPLDQEGAGSVLTRTPTGIWNPNKQDIDEIPFPQSLGSLYNPNDSDYTIPGGIDLLPESDENFDPGNVLEKKMETCSMKSPTSLAINTYNPFIWDNSSLLKSNSPSDAFAGREPFSSLPFSMNQQHDTRVSPISTGSQHSSTDSSSSVLTFNNFDYSEHNTLCALPKSCSDLWLLQSPPSGQTQSQSQSASTATTGVCQSLLSPTSRCHVCSMQQVCAALVPCGHNHFCYGCARDIVGRACPVCGQIAENALRILK